jgi:hypothetical protein
MQFYRKKLKDNRYDKIVPNVTKNVGIENNAEKMKQLIRFSHYQNVGKVAI